MQYVPVLLVFLGLALLLAVVLRVIVIGRRFAAARALLEVKVSAGVAVLRVRGAELQIAGFMWRSRQASMSGRVENPSTIGTLGK